MRAKKERRFPFAKKSANEKTLLCGAASPRRRIKNAVQSMAEIRIKTALAKYF